MILSGPPASIQHPFLANVVVVFGLLAPWIALVLLDRALREKR